MTDLSFLNECYLCYDAHTPDVSFPVSLPGSCKLEDAVPVCIACVRQIVTQKVAVAWKREQKRLQRYGAW